MDGQNDSIVLEEEIDPNYEPTEREVLEYATWLGMDLENEQDLFWIAREGLKAPLPENWKPCKTTDTEEIYYFNFATGQSTWDHPCDEFYRNLYEENKKKRAGGGGSKKAQDTDERKKKEKEDVAELLGRGKSGGKKKKAVALSRAEPLGPPTLSKAAPLEKKPLPGLSSKLGALGGGPTVGGLKSVGGLGRLKSDAKDVGESSRDDGEDSEDDQPPQPLGALSKPPLGNLLGKKPLPSAAPSASLARRDSKAEIDSLTADFEQKKQKILDDQARAVQEIETSHEQAVEALKKKLQTQRDELEDDAASSLKQKKRELDKKLNELENQFDKDESNLLRERKEKLKRLESDAEATLSQKRQDLDRELKRETERIEAKHDAMLRDLKSEHEREEKELEAKLKAALGDKARDVNAATELQSHVSKLSKDLATLESELRASREENAALQQTNSNAEAKAKQVEIEAETLQRELAALRSGGAKAADETDARIGVLTKDMAALERDLQETRNERDALLRSNSSSEATLASVRNELEALRSGDASASSELVHRVEELMTQLASLESALKASRSETETVLQLKVAAESKLEHAQREISLLRTSSTDASGEATNRAAQLTKDLAALESELHMTVREKQAMLQAKADAEMKLEQVQRELESVQTRDSATATETDARIADLEKKLAMLTGELTAAQDANEALAAWKASAEPKLEQAERKLEAMQARDSAATGETSKLIESLRDQVASLESELRVAREERSALLQSTSASEAELESAKRELSALRAGDASSVGEMSERIGELTGELKALERALAISKDEVSALTQSAASTAAQLEQARDQVGSLTREVDASRAEAAQREAAAREDVTRAHAKAAALKTEMSDLQDQLAVLSKTNAQIKEQLLKESNEKKSLREQFDAQTDAVSRDLSKVIEQLRQRVAELESDLASERSGGEELQRTCTQLRTEKQGLELEKRKSESEFARLESEKRHLESEKALLARQLKELIEAQRQQEQSSALEGHAELTKQKWEIEQLQTTLRAVESDKGRLSERVAQLEIEVESLTASSHQSAEKARVAAYKTIELENKVRAVSMERDRAAEELQVTSTELGKWKDRAEAKQKELNQTTLGLRSVEAEKLLVDEALAKAKIEMGDILAQKAGLEKSARQLKELAESQRQQEQSSALEGHAELTKQKWEIEQLQTALKAAANEKARLDERTRQLESEVETLTESNHQLAEKARVAAYKTIELENKVRAAGMERDRVVEELQTASAEVGKWKDRAETKQREVNQAIASLRAVEGERELAREALAKEKFEKDELVSQKTGLEKSKKALENELASLRFERLSVETSQRSSSGFEAQCVKLQLADVNKSELEAHLADVASQLEVSTRRCASLEARCRDQAVDMESLHVEISSLRAATQKMHLSALETLPLMERLEYEHKKRVLKSDFQSQLRDFHEREDQAVVRQKARLRAQCERQLDELVAELESKKRVRMEQEGALTLQMVEQLRQERDAKRSELKRQVRDELRDLERELLERRDLHLQTIRDVIRKDEDALSAQARESQQALREEELVRAHTKEQSGAFAPSNQQDQRLSLREDLQDEQQGDSDGDDREYVVVNAPRGTTSPLRRSRNASNSSSRKAHHRSAASLWDDVHRSASAQALPRRSKSAKEERKWRKRLEDENALLAKARALVANQRRELKKQAEQLKRDKDEWRKDQQSTRHATHSAILQEMKRMIEQNTVALSESARQVREREAWIKKRAQSIAKMQRTVDTLRSRVRRRSNNNSGYLSGDDDDDDGLSDGECDHSDVGRLLDTLERLDDELVSEAEAEYWRWPVEFASAPVEFAPAVTAWRQPAHAFASRGVAGVDSAYSSPFGADLYAPVAASRLFSSASRPYPQRMASLSQSRRTRGSAMSERAPVELVQRQISRWAKDREKVQHAATRHASWLTDMCAELKEYGAKYKHDGDERRDAAAAAAAITLLDDDRDHDAS